MENTISAETEMGPWLGFGEIGYAR